MKSIFDLEKILQDYIDFHWSGKDPQGLGWVFLKDLCGFLASVDQQGNIVDFAWEEDSTRKKNRAQLISNRDYYEIDFFDFTEYATSPIAESSKVFDLLPKRNDKRQILFFDAIQRISTEPLFESVLGGFSIDSAFLYPYNIDAVLIGLRARNLKPNNPPYNFPEYLIVLSNFKTNDTEQDYIQSFRAFVLEDHGKNLPFFLQTESNSLCKYKINRYGELEKVPNDKALDPPVYYEGMSEEEYYKNLLEYEKRRENRDIKIAFNQEFQIYFETSRLLLFLPNYIDFMYDLIVPKRITTGQRIVKKIIKTKQGKRKKRNVIKPIYKIIKSIRVRYLEENRLRHNGIIKERKWTPPKYRYLVQGHWRTLPKPSWKGNDPEGNTVLGRTWIQEYFKGSDEPTETVVLERQSKIVIKIKQPLSYGRDVIESFRQRGEVIGIQGHMMEEGGKAVDKPSAEWIYQERQKLTSALRFMILKRDNFRCQICGASTNDERRVKLQVDHKVPLVKWGLTEPDNLWTLCSECNVGKATSTVKES